MNTGHEYVHSGGECVLLVSKNISREMRGGDPKHRSVVLGDEGHHRSASVRGGGADPLTRVLWRSSFPPSECEGSVRV